jgi:hypothetical protein
MDSVLRVQARFGQHALLLTTTAAPFNGRHPGRPGTAVWERAA